MDEEEGRGRCSKPEAGPEREEVNVMPGFTDRKVAGSIAGRSAGRILVASCVF